MKSIIRLLLTGVLLLHSAGFIKAQGASLYISGKFATLRSKTFRTFSEEYNSFFTNSISTPLNPNCSGGGWGIGMHIVGPTGLVLGAEFSRVRGSTSCVFTDGAERSFQLRDQGILLYSGFSPGQPTEKIYIMPIFGFSAGQCRITSTYVPGTSGNTGEALTGIYRGLSMQYLIGIQLAGGSDHFKVFGRFDFSGPLAGLTLEDQDKPYSTMSIPVDYDTYNADPSLYVGNYVHADFKGINVSLGISLDFGD